MIKYILILSSLLFLNPVAYADVFSVPQNIRHLTVQMQGSASQLDLSNAGDLISLIATDCNLTGVNLTATKSLLQLDLSFNSLASIPDLSNAGDIIGVNFDHCFMSEANVDQILADLVESDSTTIEADLRGNAPPSSAGQANIVIIESRGGTVLID